MKKAFSEVVVLVFRGLFYDAGSIWTMSNNRTIG
jgi:hypothetical protein